MKKIKFAKKRRKLFSAILAGAMLTTSVIPESFVWASEAEEVQGFEDNEDVIFEPAEEPETEDIEESGEVEIQNLSDSQDEDDTENAVEEGFTDGVALFSSGSEMAVGTAAANTISPGEGVKITSGGTYTVQGGIYTKTGPRDPFGGVITIDTTEEVTLEITGDINMPGYGKGCFISIENACKELTIINKYTVNVDNNIFLINKNKDATVTFEGGTYEALTKGEFPIIENGGVVNLKYVKFNVTDSEKYGNGMIVRNFCSNLDLDGTINIQDGTILDNRGAKEQPCIWGGTVNMYGGTITSSEEKGATGIQAPKIKVVGGKISNFSEATHGFYKNTSITIGNVTFENNNNEILLVGKSEKQLIIQDDFKGTASIYQWDRVEYPYIITMPGTSPEMRTRITYKDADGNPHSVNYDTTEKYLYASDHVHSWSYSTSANKIIATCTEKTDCEFNPGKLDLTLAAADAYYSGNTYTGATVTNDITCQTGDEASIVYYLKDGTKTNSSNSGAASEGATPVNPGNYTVKVTLGGQTISADFKIRTQINPTVTINDWTYGEKANTPKVTVKSGGSDITTSYKETQITYTYYTDKNCTNVTTVANGASADGAVPKNAGTYYVKADVAENGNYAAGITAAVPFTIAKISVDAFVEAKNKTYDGNVSATIKATVEQSKLVPGDSIVVTGLKGTFENRNAGDNKIVTVDTSEAVISGNGADNYDVAISPLKTTASIDKRTAEFTWGNTEFIYTGTEHSIEATVKNAVSGDQLTLVYAENKKTEVGNYTVKVTDLGNLNYKLPETEKAQIDWKITYLAEGSASISGIEGKNDWYVSPVSLVPETGYKISTDKSTWSNSLEYSDQGEHSVTYYLKDANGYITDQKTVTFKIDTKAPTGKIEIGTNTFSSSLNPVAYGYWFRDNVAVDITGADSNSGIASIEYQKVKADESYDVNGTWVKWDADNKLSLTEIGKYVIYTRITDNAGNQTIINSDGVVVFKNSVVMDPSIDYTRTTKTSVDAKVTLNGNTVASVKNGENTLTAGTDYTVSADKITFRGEYLDTLAVGTYTLTVAYHPQGETQYKGGDKPAESQIALKVKQKTVNVTYQTANVKITSVLDKEYDGQPADLVYTTNSTASVKVEYNVNGIWQTKAPTYAGTYEVKVSVPGNSYFTAASTTKTYTIKPRGVEISGITANKKVYDGTKDAELDYSKVVFARLIEGDALTVSAEGTFADSNAAKGKTVTITNLVLGGRSASNYVLTADGQQAGTIADINPKRITVTADNLKKIVGGADPVLTYTASGLVGEDTLSGIVVKRKAGEKVGTYAIKVSQKKGSNPNYRITFKKGKFTIQQADQSKLKGKDIYRLKLPVFFAKGKANKNSITLSWKKYAGATGYDVYWSYCDGRINYKKVGTVKSGKLSMSHKKLKKDHEYKYFIVAYKMVEGRKIYIARSNDVHVALKQASTTNAVSIKVNRTEIALSVGKTFQLKCSLKAEDSRKDLVSHISLFRYYTTNSKVATVNKDGVIKAKGKGICIIYILANNGVYKKVTVTVK